MSKSNPVHLKKVWSYETIEDTVKLQKNIDFRQKKIFFLKIKKNC